MQNLLYIGIGKRGFAVSVDALLATMLTIGVLTFIGLGIQTPQSDMTPLAPSLKQAANDSFSVLENSGILAKNLADNELSQRALTNNQGTGIYDEVKKLLPANAELNIVITEYRAKENLAACRTAYADFLGAGATYDTIESVFDECFDEETGQESYPGISASPEKEVAHGRKIAAMKQPIIEETGGTVCVPQTFEFEEEEQALRALFEGELEADVETNVTVTDLSGGAISEISCDDTVKLTIRARNQSRDPIAIMLAMDISGSMAEYDALAQETSGTVNGSTCDGGDCIVTTNNCPTSYSAATENQFTNWTHLWSFTADADFIDRFVGTWGERLYMWWSGTRDDGGSCRIISRLKLVAPDGTEYFRYDSTNYSQHYVYPTKGVINGSHNTGDKEWDLYGWTNTPYTSSVYMRFRGYLNVNNKLDTLSGGTATGSGSECVPTGGWKKIGDLDLPTLEPGQTFQYVYGYMYYGSTYDSSLSGCRPRLYFKKSDGTDVSSIATCTGSTACERNKYYSTGDQPSGNYEVWAWSDDEISLSTVSFSYYVVDNTIGDGGGYKAIPNKALDNSSNGCNGVACTTTVETNCPTKTNWNDEEAFGTGDLDVFNINSGDNVKGLKVKVSNSGDLGTCSEANFIAQSHRSPAFRVRTNGGNSTPLETSYLTAYYCQDGYCERTITNGGSNLNAAPYELEGWAEEPTSFTVSWNLRRIDAAKKAMRDFIDNAQWQTLDKIGLVSFSDSGNANQSLTDNREAIKSSLNVLEPTGATGLALGIKKTAEELIGVAEDTGKFIVLLTDGKANICINGSACGEWAAAQDAIAEAETARDFQDIKIYVIGFADSAALESGVGGSGGISYETVLEEVAKDEDSEFCDDGVNCGKYYFAEDQAELDQLYQFIASKIAKEMGSVNIELPFTSGISPNVTDCGTWAETGGFVSTAGCSTAPNPADFVKWDPTTSILTFEDQAINVISGQWWSAVIEIPVPCTGENCEINEITFPPFGTTFTDNSTLDTVNWDGSFDEKILCDTEDTRCHKTFPFKYADLNIVFTGGNTIGGPENLSVNFEIDNNGFKDVSISEVAGIKPLSVTFYKKDFDQKLRASAASATAFIGEDDDSPIPLEIAIDDGILFIGMPNPPSPGEICSWKEGVCTQPSYWKIRVEDVEFNDCPGDPPDCTGTVIAIINNDQKVGECSLHNQAIMNCLSESADRFYVIDYYIWGN